MCSVYSLCVCVCVHSCAQTFVCVSTGFDHQHPEVYEHCKRLLLHLLVVQGTNSSVQSLASVLLRNREINDPKVLTIKPALQEFNLTGKAVHAPLPASKSEMNSVDGNVSQVDVMHAWMDGWMLYITMCDAVGLTMCHC